MNQEAIKQNTPGLNGQIQAVGCFFRAAARMAEYAAEVAGKRKIHLTIDELNSLWDQAKTAGHINENDEVQNSAAIANAALKILKVNGRFVEVATFANGKMSWYGSIPQNERRADYHIQKFNQNGPNKTHFINVNKYGELRWDPHEPAIKNRGTIYTICYRYDGETEEDQIYLERMKTELEELEGRIQRDEMFVKTDKYKSLRTYKQDLLRLQINAMDFYALMLRRRIEAEEEDK